jgi:integrase
MAGFEGQHLAESEGVLVAAYTRKHTKADIDILEPDEMKMFLLQCEKEQSFYGIAFRTDIETGLRAGELWGLQWGDIDWENGRIHVRRSLWRGNLQIPKTKSAVRKVDISGSLLHELKRWRLACPVSDDNLVFPSFQGCRVNHENVMNRHFHPLLKRAGVRRVSFHSLRHSNASLRIVSGQNIKYLSTQLGHSSIKITLDTYGHLFKDAEFTKQQVGLLESTLKSVRKPLENPLHDVPVIKDTGSNLLESHNIPQGGHFAQIDLNCMTLRYRSPRSGSMTTIVPFDMSAATRNAPATAAPLDRPTKMPSRWARNLVMSKASPSSTTTFSSSLSGL